MPLAVNVDVAFSEASPVSGITVMVPRSATLAPTRVTLSINLPSAFVRPFLTEFPPSNRAEPAAVARTSWSTTGLPAASNTVTVSGVASFRSTATISGVIEMLAGPTTEAALGAPEMRTGM